MSKTTILISGHDEAQCDSVRRLLDGQPDLQVGTRICEQSVTDLLPGQAPLPDVLIAVVGNKWEEVLHALAARPAIQRPATIVIGPDNNTHIMRRAMQIGARDFFAPPLARSDLLQAVRIIGREKGADQPQVPMGTLTAIINAKGGSGASFIAVNVAHIAAVQGRTPTALLDLDLQFGALPLALDLEQRNSLLEAIAGAPQLDPVALQGYMAKHASGVHVLSAMSEQLPLPWEISTDALSRVLSIARQTYGRVVVDLPRQIDPLTSTVLSQADHVVVVMQQSLAHIRDAKRMLRVIINNLGVPGANVTLAVNRHNDKDAVKLSDIMETVNPPSLVTLPNAFSAVSESLNTGVPLLEFDRHAGITKALQEMVARLSGAKEEGPGTAAPRRRSFREVFTQSFRSA